VEAGARLRVVPMTNDRWQQIADLFTAVQEQPEDARAEFVRARTAGDADLRREVESLLEADTGPVLLDEPLDAAAALLVDNAPVLIGRTLGPYRIDALLGLGGMGEVYRARDTKLNRNVAIKTLPPAFASDPDRLARFKREAQVLASLNHSNIGGIYGFEDSDDVHALVLELVEGPTLADVLQAGSPRPLPLTEALAIARQIADALECAHEQGIVHRDLKPANIKIKEDGTVKVLDFGLAKAIEGERSRGVDGTVLNARGDATRSPTITTPAMTAAGMILGTAAYMSPEQAKGKPADKRSDVWAFGCVFYEMLTGTRAFQGEDVAETLAEVIKGTPDWTRVPASVPESIRTLLRRCLEKERRQRIADSSVMRFVLESDPHVPEPAVVTRPRALVVVAIAVAAAVTSGVTWWLAAGRAGAVPEVSRLEMPLEEGQRFTGPGRHVIAISPDGRYLAFTANEQLFIRPLDQLTATPVRNSGGERFAREPFFSPDSQWLGFWHDGYLKKVPVNGGLPVPLAEVQLPRGVHWEADGTILFGQGSEGIWQLPGEGGTPRALVTMEPGRVADGPQMIPGRNAVLFTMLDGASNGWEDAQIVVRTLNDDIDHVLVRGGADARYLADGHIIYAADDALLVAPLDTNTWTLGSTTTRVEGVARAANAQTPVAHYSVSRTGTLAYVAGSFRIVPLSTPTWIDRQGRETQLEIEPRRFLYPRLSPAGDRLAVSVRDEFESIWSWDFGRRTLTRVTNTGIRENYPVWTPDGSRLIFSVSRGGISDLWMQQADGGSTPTPLTQTPIGELGTSITPDGSRLIFHDPNAGDVLMLALTGERHVEPLLSSRFFERNAEISPDGRWIAYESNESGQFEVYVRPFPNVTDSRHSISSGGGRQPAWGRDMKELFFLRPNGSLMGVTIAPDGGSWQAGTPRQLLDQLTNPVAFSFIGGRLYDVSSDGKRFLFLKTVPSAEGPRLPASVIVVQNWATELTREVDVLPSGR
jgi:Tol biopolymer transport system component